MLVPDARVAKIAGLTNSAKACKLLNLQTFVQAVPADESAIFLALPKMGRNLMPYRILSVALALTFTLAGCATKPQLPVNFDAKSVSTGAPSVGIAMTALPKPEVHMPGAGCLLCIIAAQVANSELSRHTDTLTTEEVAQLKQRVADSLKKQGATVKVIAEPIDVRALPDAEPKEGAARKNFASLKQKYGVDKLVVLEVTQIGFERAYSAYIPVSDPKGLFRGVGYLVDLGTNKYDWYLPVDVTKSSDGRWDEPKKFPGLTNAYFQAVEIGQDRLIKPLAN